MPRENTVEGMLVTLKYGPTGRRNMKWTKVRYKPSKLHELLKHWVDDETMMVATSIVFVDHTARPRILKHRNLRTSAIEHLDTAFDEIER